MNGGFFSRIIIRLNHLGEQAVASTQAQRCTASSSVSRSRESDISDEERLCQRPRPMEDERGNISARAGISASHVRNTRILFYGFSRLLVDDFFHTTWPLIRESTASPVLRHLPIVRQNVFVTDPLMRKHIHL